MIANTPYTDLLQRGIRLAEKYAQKPQVVQVPESMCRALCEEHPHPEGEEGFQKWLKGHWLCWPGDIRLVRGDAVQFHVMDREPGQSDESYTADAKWFFPIRVWQDYVRTKRGWLRSTIGKLQEQLAALVSVDDDGSSVSE